MSHVLVNGISPEGLTIEQRVANIEHDIAWQNHLHRNVDSDGNIRHTWSVLPVLATAVIIGMLIGYSFHKTFIVKTSDTA